MGRAGHTPGAAGGKSRRAERTTTVKNQNQSPTAATKSALKAARAVVDDLTSVPDLLAEPTYRRFATQVYLTARAASELADWLGDADTARAIDRWANELGRLAAF